jgi:hypothetical protein
MESARLAAMPQEERSALAAERVWAESVARNAAVVVGPIEASQSSISKYRHYAGESLSFAMASAAPGERGVVDLHALFSGRLRVAAEAEGAAGVAAAAPRAEELRALPVRALVLFRAEEEGVPTYWVAQLAAAVALYDDDDEPVSGAQRVLYHWLDRVPDNAGLFYLPPQKRGAKPKAQSLGNVLKDERFEVFILAAASRAPSAADGVPAGCTAVWQLTAAQQARCDDVLQIELIRAAAPIDSSDEEDAEGEE